MNTFIRNLKLEIRNSWRSQGGFTLLELLVVIAIIGILTALVITNVVGIRQRANDGRRKADLRQIQSALEFYRADNGAYPVDSGYPNCPLTGTKNSLGNPICTNIYLSKIPADPSGIAYYYNSDGKKYVVVSCLENTNDPDKLTTIPTLDGTGTVSTYSNCPVASSYYVLRNP